MTPYPLSKTDTGTKVLITLFLATIAVSISVAELNVRDKVKFTPAGVVARYGPEEEPVDSPAGGFAGDAAAEPTMAEEPLVARMNTFTLLLDVTHPHVFELPLVVFVLAHFLMRTRAASAFKLVTYFLGFGGIVLFLGTPWMVRYVALGWAPMMLVGAFLVGLASMVMIAVSLWDMWTKGKTGRR